MIARDNCSLEFLVVELRFSVFIFQLQLLLTVASSSSSSPSSGLVEIIFHVSYPNGEKGGTKSKNAIFIPYNILRYISRLTITPCEFHILRP